MATDNCPVLSATSSLSASRNSPSSGRVRCSTCWANGAQLDPPAAATPPTACRVEPCRLAMRLADRRLRDRQPQCGP